MGYKGLVAQRPGGMMQAKSTGTAMGFRRSFLAGLVLLTWQATVPTPASAQGASGDIEVMTDVLFGEAGGKRLFMNVFLPTSGDANPAVVGSTGADSPQAASMG
jgi:hypothetical protein